MYDLEVGCNLCHKRFQDENWNLEEGIDSGVGVGKEWTDLVVWKRFFLNMAYSAGPYAWRHRHFVGGSTERVAVFFDLGWTRDVEFPSIAQEGRGET